MFSSPGQKPSKLLQLLGICRPSLFTFSHFNLLLKLLGQMVPNFAGMILGKIV